MPNLAVDVDSWGRSACYPRSTFYPLSDGHSTLGRRITRTYFRICSTCLSRSQARFYSCALRTVADRPERTLRAPPLPFGRRPPQSNYPSATVLCPDNGTQLEFQLTKSGIPTASPRKPKSPSHRLPPILCIPNRNSIADYSKAPWGLSV